MTAKLVLDANLLVLSVVGELDPALIPQHKRLRAYGAQDYKLLRETVAASSGLVLIPNILTEASNLLRHDREPRRTALANVLREIVDEHSETYVASRAAVSTEPYGRLGLSDAAILVALDEGHSLLTADAELYVAAAYYGFEAVNFNHLRAAALDL